MVLFGVSFYFQVYHESCLKLKKKIHHSVCGRNFFVCFNAEYTISMCMICSYLLIILITNLGRNRKTLTLTTYSLKNYIVCLNICLNMQKAQDKL